MTHKLNPDQERARIAWLHARSVAWELFPDGPPESVWMLLDLATFKLINEPQESTLLYHAARDEAVELWTRFYGPVDDTHGFFYPPPDPRNRRRAEDESNFLP